MTSQQTRFFHTLFPCLNLCVFKKKEEDGQVPGVEEWTPGSSSFFEESEVDSASVALAGVWWLSFTDACHQAKNLPIPMECSAKYMGTTFLTYVQIDWSAPCCPISRIAVLSLHLPSASFEGKCRSLGLGRSLGFYGPWGMTHQLSDLYFRVKCYRLHRHHIELQIHAKEMLSLFATNAAHFPFKWE